MAIREVPASEMEMHRLRADAPNLATGYYPRQAAAIAYAQCNGCVPVWSRDVPGAVPERTVKQYWVASYRCFYDRFVRMPAEHRCQYEILERDMPVHIYMDFDWLVDMNPRVTLDGTLRPFVRDLVAYLRDEALPEMLDASSLWDDLAEGVDEPVRVVWLDSSRGNRGSYHATVKLFDGALMFADNVQVGALMRRFDRYMLRRDPTLYRLNTKNGATDAFIADMAIYTKNRAFRVPYSSKLGQNRPLALIDVPAPPGGSVPVDYARFVDALVGYVDVERLETLLSVTEHDGTPAVSTSKTFRRSEKATSRVVCRQASRRMVSAQHRTRSVTEERASTVADDDEYSKQIMDLAVETIRAIDGDEAVRMGTDTRYYVDGAVVWVLTRWHYCHKRGGTHNNNHVYYMFRLDEGNWNQNCYCRCPPPNGCRDKKFTIHPIPDDYLQRFRRLVQQQHDSFYISLASLIGI